ncbi:hypothetical protein Clacol_010419 [Clathrus columnatus]|uniref:Enoyl reductase (ER) domain-containing protein n=1 Tax=Clathrus columnatus TaxID=1419009 RepID=A0AAV5ANF3_9AGAM|nr:hypothetical protein Clacol_010419 [Clathrus columnatus]
MSVTIPEKMRACLVHEDKKVEVQEIPVPLIDDDEVLIKVHAVAQNPTDWKQPQTIIGCDFSGTVVKLGNTAEVQGLVKIGDHVAGFLQGGTYTDRGAFAEYVKTPADLVWRVPRGTLTHEEAATMGCGLWTAVQALYHPDRLGLIEPPSKTEQNEWIFIQGGSSEFYKLLPLGKDSDFIIQASVGQYAIQLAHASGYKVATVASSHNHNLVKNLGADIVFDYKSPTVITDIKSATGDNIHIALDAFSTPESQQLTTNILAPGKGKIILILGIDETSKNMRPDVEFQGTLIYTALGKEFSYGKTVYHASESDRGHMASFLPKISALVESGDLRPNKVKLWEGGLSAVNEGFEYMQAGNVSGIKIVYRVPA